MPSASRPPKKPAAKARWESLSNEEQLAVVRLACGLRGKAIKRRFDGILAVGAGFKKSAGVVSPNTCIGLLVQRKLTSSLVRPVPDRLIVSLPQRGNLVRYSIPTDVEELADGAPHALVNLANGVRAFNRHNPTQGVPGAACCVVVDVNDKSNRFVLSCHHVLALSLITGGCSAFNQSSLTDRSKTRRIGSLHSYTDLAPGGSRSLDAALALVSPDVEVAWVAPGGVQPTRVEPGNKRPLDCDVYVPDGQRISATFVKEWADVPLNYSCGVVVIEAAYQFVAATVGGHSGSPVMSPDGTLHGMHFWGDPAHQLAMAIPAFVLFRPGVFPVAIRLP